MQYSVFYGHVCGYYGDALTFYDGDQWVRASYLKTNAGSSSTIGASGSNACSAYGGLFNTSSSSTLPPYITVYAWQRTA